MQCFKNNLKQRPTQMAAASEMTISGSEEAWLDEVTKLDFTIPTELCRIMDSHKSDKGSATAPMRSHHNYTIVYDFLFGPMRHRPLRVFELGIGTNHTDVPSSMGRDGRPGASLFGWRDYFSEDTTIYGADIDRRILFEDTRIRTYYCDQTSPDAIRDLWSSPELKDLSFDIMIDDGLHLHDANKCFFENSIHKLNVGGYFIIEDLYFTQLHQHHDTMLRWRSTYPNMKFALVGLPSFVNKNDNTLLIVRRDS